MKTNTLLIWDDMSVKLKFYLIPDDFLNNEDIKMMKIANGEYLNGYNINYVEYALCAIRCSVTDDISIMPKSVDGKTNVDSKWFSRFVKFSIKSNKIIDKKISKIIYCGVII